MLTAGRYKSVDENFSIHHQFQDIIHDVRGHGPRAVLQSIGGFEYTRMSVDRPRLRQTPDLSGGQAEQIAKHVLVVLAQERRGARERDRHA